MRQTISRLLIVPFIFVRNIVIINCLIIVVSPYMLSSKWIVMTNAHVFHNN